MCIWPIHTATATTQQPAGVLLLLFFLSLLLPMAQTAKDQAVGVQLSHNGQRNGYRPRQTWPIHSPTTWSQQSLNRQFKGHVYLFSLIFLNVFTFDVLLIGSPPMRAPVLTKDKNYMFALNRQWNETQESPRSWLFCLTERPSNSGLHRTLFRGNLVVALLTGTHMRYTSLTLSK